MGFARVVLGAEILGDLVEAIYDQSRAYDHHRKRYVAVQEEIDPDPRVAQKVKVHALTLLRRMTQTVGDTEESARVIAKRGRIRLGDHREVGLEALDHGQTHPDQVVKVKAEEHEHYAKHEHVRLAKVELDALPERFVGATVYGEGFLRIFAMLDLGRVAIEIDRLNGLESSESDTAKNADTRQYVARQVGQVESEKGVDRTNEVRVGTVVVARVYDYHDMR